MKKKVEFTGKYITVLPGVQQISDRTYRARVQVGKEKMSKLFTNKQKAHSWYKEQKQKLTSN